MDTKINFTLEIIRELLKNNFSVFLHNKENLDGYGGWLETDEGNEQICVAMKHHMGFEILLHEYCHFKQFKEDKELWEGESTKDYDLLFDWASDKSLEATEEELDRSLYSILKVEHDCERRAIKILTTNPIEGVDLNKYIKAANSYLWSYHIVRKIRKKSKNPIYTDNVLKCMPNKFENDLNYYLDVKNLKKEMEEALLIEISS